jgi:hypothetical protein
MKPSHVSPTLSYQIPQGSKVRPNDRPDSRSISLRPLSMVFGEHKRRRVLRYRRRVLRYLRIRFPNSRKIEAVGLHRDSPQSPSSQHRHLEDSTFTLYSNSRFIMLEQHTSLCRAKVPCSTTSREPEKGSHMLDGRTRPRSKALGSFRGYFETPRKCQIPMWAIRISENGVLLPRRLA